MSFKPTNEQTTCISSYGIGDSFKVEAVAGSGKTSTVKLMAESDSTKKALYLAFNKAAAEEASTKMPSHVTCRTTHSMAYSAFGAKYREKLSRPRGGYVNVAGTVSEMVRYFKIKNTGSMTKNALARLAKLTVAAFEASAEDSIQRNQVPPAEIQKMQDKADKAGEEFHAASAVLATVKLATKLWEARIDLSSPVLITHDTYLKMWQLSKPYLNYGVIFLDEAQDTSDCVIDVVLGQDHCQVVCVGDSFQAIYGWRGAVNALAKIKTQSTPLSQSFRYGPAVAEVATHILDGAVTVRGFDKLNTVVGKVDKSEPYVILYRTNAALIEDGIDLINEGESVNIDIDTRGYVKKLEAMVLLHEEAPANKIKHEDICIFEDWDELLEEVELVKGELGRMAKTVESGEHVEVLEALSTYVKPRIAHIKLTTAHKSKGMEYAQVILAGDFPDVVVDSEYKELPDIERNLLYVAATRAMVRLELNNTVRDIIEHRIQQATEHEFNKQIKKEITGWR